MTDETKEPLSDADVRHIIALMEALERAQFDSLQLDVGNWKLTLGKGGPISFAPAPPATPAGQAPPTSPASRGSVAASVQTQPTPLQAAANADAADLINVRAPIMGMFYSRPDPASPPFVSVGSEVDETMTVGLIEVMKVFNAVQAGAKGTIVEICVQDAATIEIGQTLFRIHPTNVT